MNAQTTLPTPVGNYLLRGVMETASGFQLNEDNTFRFFFSYGALDRYGEGLWNVKGDTLILNSRPKPAQEFTLVDSGKAPGNKITIQIEEKNTSLLRYFYCRIKGGDQLQEGAMNDKGRIEFTPQVMDTIELLFEFCPEKKTVFVVGEKSHNHFVFVPAPSLMEVFFRDFRLALTSEGLSGGHPLSDKTSFRYEKAK